MHNPAVLYYTHHAKPDALIRDTWTRISEQAKRLGMQAVMIGTKPTLQVNPDCIVLERITPWPADIFRRILTGCEKIPLGATVFLAEDDVLYPDIHFLQDAPEFVWYYNVNVIYASRRGFFRRYLGAPCLHQSFGVARVIASGCRSKILELDRGSFRYIEPASCDGYRTLSRIDMTASIDIREGQNIGWSDDGNQEYYAEATGWPPHPVLWQEIAPLLG